MLQEIQTDRQSENIMPLPLARHKNNECVYCLSDITTACCSVAMCAVSSWHVLLAEVVQNRGDGVPHWDKKV